MASERLNSILSHLSPSKSGLSAITQKNPDDVVITLAIRTPLTKGFKGGMKDTPLDYIVYTLLKEVLEKSNIDPQMVEDVCLGNVSNGKAAYIARAASLAAGYPTTAAASSVNRFCSSGLKAVQDVANQISMGSIDCGVAIGAESMSAGGDRLEKPFHESVLQDQNAKDCMQPMGQTSENVGKDFDISREAQDRFAAESYQRAERAQKAGWFDDEIVPFKTKIKDPKTGEEKDVILTKDEGPRYGTTFDSLSKIRPAFPDYGDKSTGGNSSQVTDGAAAVLLMKRSKAIEMHQPILAKFCGATVAGVAPRIMGIGPSLAIPKLLGKFNLDLKNDIDIIELNEAFASMAVYCTNVLGIDPAKMNVRGGAIALGHPLGATGARQICTGLSECRRQKKKILLTSMCIGTGQGMAGLFVNEQLLDRTNLNIMSEHELPICTACGSQFDSENGTEPLNCKICDDPRQFVPPSGQSWTTLSKIQRAHGHSLEQDEVDDRVWWFQAEPKFAIGQRVFLLLTPAGNVLWDMIAVLDDATIEEINRLGGLKAIVISHPHYYTTYVEWWKAFKCPIYVGADDQGWVCRRPPSEDVFHLIDGPAGTTVEVLPGVTAIKTGGHFPGSLVLHWEKKLFIADTIVTVPSAYTPHPRPPGQTSFVFQWSIPNAIPLPPDDIFRIWQAIEPFDFNTTHGAFAGMEIRDKGLKRRMLESMQIQVRGEGWKKHAILEQTVD